MNYLKSLFFQFLIVFFANHILPGIDVVSQTKLPHFGGDLFFAIVLGLINSLIYPVLKMLKQPAVFKILLCSAVVNFVVYALLKVLPIGIHVTSVHGYLYASVLVTLVSFLINFLEMKHTKHCASSSASHTGCYYDSNPQQSGSSYSHYQGDSSADPFSKGNDFPDKH